LALPLLAALTPADWEVEIIYEFIEDVNFDAECDLVGVGTMGHSIFRAIEIAKEFRKRGKKVFSGGCITSMTPEELIQHVDSIVIGDGEISYPQLLNDFVTTSNIQAVYDNQLATLENIPLPRYDLLVKKKIGMILPVQATRGCPNRCSFCCTACIYEGKYLTRPVEDVIRDIKEIKRLGYKSFYLVDDNIYGRKSFLKEFIQQVTPLKMKWSAQCTIEVAKDDELLRQLVKSGCKILGFGLEKKKKKSVDLFNKSWVKTDKTSEYLAKIRKAGIILHALFIVGTDEDTPETMQATYEFIVKNKIAIPNISILTPIPGSNLYKQLLAQSRILHFDFSKYHASSCVFKPEKMSPEEVVNHYWKLKDRLFTISCIVRRTLFSKYFFKNPEYYIFAFFSNFFYRKNYKRRNGSIVF
jgi:radical SAM superfamily enzyme YgiQ (UPF0313 family)